MQTKHEVADVLNRFWDKKQTLNLNGWQIRTLDAIRRCRTAALGGHIDACDGCGNLSISYNSCRNRHCPKCQGEKRASWVEKRLEELLPVPYFHVVFTLPHELNQLAMHEPKAVYDALFAASWHTLAAFSKDVKYLSEPSHEDKGVQGGMIAVLHTWGQNLSLHPHLHCIVPGGGVDKAGKWISFKSKGKYLFSTDAMGLKFRGKYLAELRARLVNGLDKELSDALYAKEWVVFCKPPFGSPASVVEYLGRYTHKVAISNNRIQSISDTSVTFSYKDYKDESKQKYMTVSPMEFVRLCSLHILPKGYMKKRHFGILSSTWKPEKLPSLQQKLWDNRQLPSKASGPARPCACCKTGNLRTILSFDHRGPPIIYKEIWAKLQSQSQS
jgi:hypothetical protein